MQSLNQNNMDIILKSLISAVITGLILLLANYSNPKLAGALGGIPIVFAVSYVLITMQNKTFAKDFLLGGCTVQLRQYFLV